MHSDEKRHETAIWAQPSDSKREMLRLKTPSVGKLFNYLRYCGRRVRGERRRRRRLGNSLQTGGIRGVGLKRGENEREGGNEERTREYTGLPFGAGSEPILIYAASRARLR